MTHLTTQHLAIVKAINGRLPSQHAMKMLAKAGQTISDSHLYILQLARLGVENAEVRAYSELRPTLEALTVMAEADPQRAYQRLTANGAGDSLMQPFITTRTPGQAAEYLLGMLVA